MRKHLFAITVISASLVMAGCTTNPYTGESQVGNVGIGAAVGTAVGAGIGILASSKKDRGKGAAIGAAVGAALGGSVGYYMDVQEAKLREQLRGTGVSVTRDGNNIILNMPNNVTFDTGQSALKAAGINTLMGVSMVLKEYDKTAISVVGHTDSTGSNDTNMRLSQQRANTVAGSLISQGVSANRVYTTGVASSQPIASNDTADGRAQNRRVTVTLSPL